MWSRSSTTTWRQYKGSVKGMYKEELEQYTDLHKEIEELSKAIETAEKKKEILKERQKKAQQEELRILEFINTVSDSRIRRAMQYRYIDGLTWEEVGKRVNYDRSTLSKLVHKYLDEN